MSEVNGRIHRYHADATILSGNLSLPLVQQIEPQAHAHLREEGGYLSERVENYRVESVLSFRSAYTHVAGNPNTKPGKGWTTLTTTVVEGLNVLDVVTADRVVGQTITDYPQVGYVPSISFLGSRFENLRIAGHAVEIDIDPNILGEKPENDGFYTRHDGVLSRVRKQYERILGHGHLPEDLGQQYNRLNTSLGSAETLECSLVNHASGRYPGHSFGHKVRIPGFGEITLAKLTVEHESPKPESKKVPMTTVSLTMVEFKLGCVIEGNVAMGRISSNGQTVP